MKSNFTPREFVTMLDSITEVIRVMANSQQYQQLINSDHYYSDEYHLNDAIEALENVSSGFCNMHNGQLDPIPGICLQNNQNGTQLAKRPS